MAGRINTFMSAPSFAWAKVTYPSALVHALREQGALVTRCDEHLSALPSMLRAEGRRVLHMHWLHPLCHGRTFVIPLFKGSRFLLRLRVARAKGVRIVWTAHNLSDHESVRPMLDAFNSRQVARMAHAIIAHSDVAKELVIGHFGVDPAKVHVIPHANYVDLYPRTVSREDARATLGIESDTTVLLFLGGIRPYKGINLLLDAFASIDAPKLRLRVVGSVFEDMDLSDLTARAERDSRVELVPGFVPDEQLQIHLRAADAVVLPYEQVLTSGAALLAMSFAKACIASRVGALVDIFPPEGVFHYRAGSQDGLAAAIRSCFQERAALASRGQANFDRAAPWTWRAAARQTQSLYEDLFAE